MRTTFSKAATSFVVSAILLACGGSSTQGPGANSASGSTADPTTAMAGQPAAAQAPSPSTEKSDGGW